MLLTIEPQLESTSEAQRGILQELDIQNTMATPELSISPAAKHRKSLFGFEPTYEKRWDSAVELNALHQKTPHRYQQSPVFARKMVHSKSDSGTHGKHHHHHHHKHHRGHRKRGVSEGESSSSSSSSSSSDEKVHLLSSLPWKNANTSEESIEDEAVKRKVLSFSKSLPHRLDSRLQYEKERKYRSPNSSPLCERRHNGTLSPCNDFDCDITGSCKENSISNPNYVQTETPQPAYRGHLVIDFAAVPLSSSITSPDDPVTPQADSDEYHPLPPHLETIDENFPPPPSPHTLRAFLGLDVEPIPEQGLSEEEIFKARIFSRRFSASSESSTNTLTDFNSQIE